MKGRYFSTRLLLYESEGPFTVTGYETSARL